MVFQARIFFDVQQVLVFDKTLERALAKRFMGFSSFAFQPFIQFVIQMPFDMTNGVPDVCNLCCNNSAIQSKSRLVYTPSVRSSNVSVFPSNH